MSVTIPAAFLMRRLPLKPVLIISGLLTAAGALLVIFYPQTFYIATGMIVVGLMGSFSAVVGGPLIMKGTSTEHQPFLFSVNFALGLVSGIFGNMLAGGLPDLLKRYNFSLVEGYKISLLVHVAITILAVIPVLFIKTRSVTENRGEHFFQVKTPWRRIISLALPHVLVGLGAGLTIPFLNLYFRDKFGLAPTQLGILFSVAQVLMVLGTLVAPYIASRWGKIKTVIVFQMISVPFLFILSLSVNVWLSIAAFLVRGALMNMAQPLVTNFSLEMTREHDHPLMSGIMTVAWLASWGVSANLGGHLIESAGYFLPFNLTLAAYILSSIVYFFVLLPLERRSRSSSK
jgi:MFS family permease